MITFKEIVEGLLRGEKLIDDERKKQATKKESRRKPWKAPQSDK